MKKLTGHSDSLHTQYQRLFECAQDGMLILDYPSGFIIDANPFICHLLGYTKDYFINKKLWELGFVEDKQMSLKMFSELVKKEYVRYENIQLKKINGESIEVEFISNAYFVNQHKVIQCNIRDISDRVKNINLEKKIVALKIQNLNNIIDCLSTIIEARDPYTSGHQFRVADLAVRIAKYMKLAKERVLGVRYAAILHDIGKYKIPIELLVKPQKLSTAEYNLIKTHPEAGADIVKGLNFEQDVARFILEHHERLDGSGYPKGLKAEQISLEAKIIAVADVMEAISSYRPYRPALGIRQSLKEITKNQGKQYDVDVVNACIHLFLTEDYAFPIPELIEGSPWE
jgi:PAS domain S-box-containing protein/putative nucleotidyltransferase with HDIG domain